MCVFNVSNNLGYVKQLISHNLNYLSNLKIYSEAKESIHFLSAFMFINFSPYRSKITQNIFLLKVQSCGILELLNEMLD